MSSTSLPEFEKLDEIHLTKKDEIIAALETENQKLKEKLHEAYFWSAFIIVGLFDALAFKGMALYDIAGLLIFEGVGLLAAAKRCEIKFIVEILSIIFEKVLKFLER